MKPSFFRILVKWVGLLLVIHLVAMIAFGIVLSGIVGQMLGDPTTVLRGKITFLAFDVIFFFIAIFIYEKAEMSLAEYRRNLRNRLKEDGFSSLDYYKSESMRLHIWKLALVVVFQLPFALFFNSFGYVFDNITSFEQFYALDAGAYVATGSAILGILINAVLFGIALLGAWWCAFLITKRSLKEDMI